MPAVPYMMLSCFTFALWPFHTINLKGIMALGRSDVFLRLEIIKKSLCLIVILFCYRLGVFTWMAISAFVLGPLSVMINSWPNRKLLDYKIGMQLRDVLPTALVCCVQAVLMVGVGFLVDIVASRIDVPSSGAGYLVFIFVKLALQWVLGIAAFFTLSYIAQVNPMCEYARMAAAAVRNRWPRVAELLERRFA